MNWRADELDSFNNWNSFVNFIVSKTCFRYGGIYMAFLKVSEMSWKEKQISAINRLSKAKGWSNSDTNPYFERVWNVIYNDKIKTKQQMKEELKKHGYK